MQFWSNLSAWSSLRLPTENIVSKKTVFRVKCLKEGSRNGASNTMPKSHCGSVGVAPGLWNSIKVKMSEIVLCRTTLARSVQYWNYAGPVTLHCWGQAMCIKSENKKGGYSSGCGIKWIKTLPCSHRTKRSHLSSYMRSVKCLLGAAVSLETSSEKPCCLIVTHESLHACRWYDISSEMYFWFCWDRRSRR